MKKVRLLLILLATMLLFAACNQLPTLKKRADGYFYSKTKELYVEAPVSFLAARRTKQQVALLVDKSGDRPLYSAGENLLCEENGALYVLKGTLFPSLDEFHPTRLNLCKEEVIRTEIATSVEDALLDGVVQAFEANTPDAESLELLQGFSYARYVVLLSSKDYSDYCYRLEYSLYEKGEDPYGDWPYETETIGLLYDRGQDRYAIAPEGLETLLAGGRQ